MQPGWVSQDCRGTAQCVPATPAPTLTLSARSASGVHLTAGRKPPQPPHPRAVGVPAGAANGHASSTTLRQTNTSRPAEVFGSRSSRLSGLILQSGL